MLDKTSPMPKQIPTADIQSRKHKGIIPIAAVVIVVIVAIFIFASYEGYIPFLKISTSTNPYYSVANIQQLSSVSSSISNKSNPFNMSYDFTLQLKAKTGPLNLSFNLPIKGFVEHYSPVTRQTANIYLVNLQKQVAALSGSNISSLPSAFDILNLTILTNSTGGELCVPFSVLLDGSNPNIQAKGLLLNDTSLTNSSLICIYVNDKNIISNPLSLLNSTSSLNISQLNVSELNGLNKSLTIKFVNNEVYNGNKCSLISINTTNSFEKEYNASFGFDLCFSNSYGVALYGNFLLNLTKDAGVISSILGSSGSAPSFSNIIISGSLTSSFENPPVSLSSVSSLPSGSYSTNLSRLVGLAQANLGGATSVQAPAALSNYVKTYFPSLVLDQNLSSSGYYTFSSPALILPNSTVYTPGIRLVFSSYPALGENLSELISYSTSYENISIDGYAGLETNYTSGNVSVDVAYILANGNLYAVSGDATGSLYGAQFNSSFPVMLNNFKPSYLS
jgi:hypothetical protein